MPVKFRELMLGERYLVRYRIGDGWSVGEFAMLIEKQYDANTRMVMLVFEGSHVIARMFHINDFRDTFEIFLLRGETDHPTPGKLSCDEDPDE